MKKTVMIRADASEIIGSGHIMRCLVLADELQNHGVEVIFICRTLQGNLSEYITKRGFRVLSISTQEHLSISNQDIEIDFIIDQIQNLHLDPSWLIVDHYEIDESWELALRKYVKRILVIDDLANRKHNADILMDQNLIENGETRYHNLVPSTCELYVGPQYLLLRSSFYKQRKVVKKRSGKVKEVLLFFGGSDPTNETQKIMDSIQNNIFSNLHFNLIIGNSYAYQTSIVQQCATLAHVQLYIQTENMAEIIATSDFCIGAGGSAMWERCFLGLPSAVTIVANNQYPSVSMAERLGIIWNLGNHEQINSSHYTDILLRAMSSPLDLINMSKHALEVLENETSSEQNIITSIILKKMDQI